MSMARACTMNRSVRCQVFTRGTPPRKEGCRSASRGCVLTLMTCNQCERKPSARQVYDGFVTFGEHVLEFMTQQ